MEKIEFETYRPIGNWEIHNVSQKEPSCFNSEVRIKRYKITVEEIEDPIEVLQDRLEDLWSHSDNYHDYEALQAEAKKLNYTFKNKFGSKTKRRIK